MAPPTIAPATTPGAQPRQPRRHCTASTWGAAAFLSDVGAVIGAAPAGAANDPAPAARAATARSLQGIFMTLSPVFLTLRFVTDGAAASLTAPRPRHGATPWGNPDCGAAFRGPWYAVPLRRSHPRVMAAACDGGRALDPRRVQAAQKWNRLRACAVTAKAKDRRNQEHRSMTATTVRLALVALACAVAAPASAQLLQRKELSYPIALTIAQAALEDCKARGYATSVVVVDRGGNTVVALRADNASAHTMENARRKAYTAMTFKMTTADFIKDMATRPVRREQTTLPNVIAIDGGVPLKVGDDVIGGVGLSGSPGIDEQCVMAGINKVKDQLQ